MLNPGMTEAPAKNLTAARIAQPRGPWIPDSYMPRYNECCCQPPSSVSFVTQLQIVNTLSVTHETERSSLRRATEQ